MAMDSTQQSHIVSCWGETRIKQTRPLPVQTSLIVTLCRATSQVSKKVGGYYVAYCHLKSTARRIWNTITAETHVLYGITYIPSEEIVRQLLCIYNVWSWEKLILTISCNHTTRILSEARNYLNFCIDYWTKCGLIVIEVTILDKQPN